MTLGGRRVRIRRLGSAPPTAPASWRCRPTRRSPPPSCSTSSRSNGCWPSCPVAATRPGWNRSAPRSSRQPRGPPSRRSRVGSWPGPSTHWPSCSPPDLSSLDLVALMVDGIRVAEHSCVVALGITIDGTKVPLALAEGATENATVVRELLVGCASAASRSTRPILVVHRRRQGAAPRRRPTSSTTRSSSAASSTSSATSPTGCPTRVASTVAKRMRRAYHHADPLVAQAELKALARELDRSHPSAAASACGKGSPRPSPSAGSACHPRSLGPYAARTRIESMIEICRDHAANVKRWQDGQIVLRWVAAGMGEARQAVPPRQRLPAPARPARRPRPDHRLLSHQPRRICARAVAPLRRAGHQLP